MEQGFVWISAADRIPTQWDLRLVGWELWPPPPQPDLPRLYDCRDAFRRDDWRLIAGAARCVAVGVDCAGERAAMLEFGYADALGTQITLCEPAVRLGRVRASHDALPRRRRVGPLCLDLFHRDARVGERWLALHPREFALLWHLAARPGERVSRPDLLSEVWRLRHMPETNALEVHVSRLRAKLAVAGLSWLVETDPLGGYRLARAAAAAKDGWTVTRALRTTGSQ